MPKLGADPRGRKIVVHGQEWHWSVRRGVMMINPSGKSYHVDPEDVIECTPDVFERGQWKRTSDGVVSPARVAAFISDLILIEKHS